MAGRNRASAANRPRATPAWRPTAEEFLGRGDLDPFAVRTSRSVQQNGAAGLRSREARTSDHCSVDRRTPPPALTRSEFLHEPDAARRRSARRCIGEQFRRRAVEQAEGQRHLQPRSCRGTDRTPSLAISARHFRRSRADPARARAMTRATRACPQVRCEYRRGPALPRGDPRSA